MSIKREREPGKDIEIESLFKKIENEGKVVLHKFKEEKNTKLEALKMRLKNDNPRKAGILMHPSSLPGEYGIGTLGKSSYEFVDFLEKSEQKLWQLFPLGPTGYGDSPYQCFSAFAGNPYLVDLEELVKEGLLSQEEIEVMKTSNPLVVDYGRLYEVKLPLLKNAYDKKDLVRGEFEKFKDENASWLDDYAMFMALKKHFNGISWKEWDKDIKERKAKALDKYSKELEREIDIEKFIQFLFFRQWLKLKEYANSKGISIIGDIPIFVSMDSSDAWSNSNLFVFESVAGVPPDYFSATGQLWGNPLYNWAEMKKTNYSWWKDRIRENLKLYDIIRLDHFRGFESYWQIPATEKTAINGKWIKGPGEDLFNEIFKDFPNLKLIAEDLGVITDEVKELKDKFKFPGMKVLQFAFDKSPKNEYLVHNYEKNSVVYTGTHDNNTTLGWYLNLQDDEKADVRDYLDQPSDEGICWHLIRLALRSVSDTCIIPMQDYLEYGQEARINTPGLATGNWQWRLGEGILKDELAQRIAHVTKIYGR